MRNSKHKSNSSTKLKLKGFKLSLLQRVINSMSNWQNSQWLRYATNKGNIEQACAYACMDKPARDELPIELTAQDFNYD